MKSTRPVKLILMVSAVMLLPSSLAAMQEEYNSLKPGLWEIRTNTQMLNMPVELPPVPYRTTQCLTQDQLNNQENLTAVSGAQGDCEIRDANVTATRSTWSMTCIKNGLNFDGKGSITPISLETYTGSFNFVMSGAQNMPPMNGLVTLQGTWQGECTGAEKTHMDPVFSHPGSQPEMRVREVH